MAKGLLSKKGLEGLRLKGHDRDDDEDGVIHKGHDTFQGKGLGHSKGTKGSDGSGKCSDGSGKPGTGTKGSGTGTGDCHDYVCGGTLPCVRVEDGDSFVFDIDSPFRSSGDANTLYTIVSDPDDMFEVDPTTGELSFKDGAVFDAAPDADNKYEVTVRATDLFNPCKPKDVTLCVEVTGDPITPGGPPVFTVETLAPSVFSTGASGNPNVALVVGQSANIADYAIIGEDAAVLELIEAPELDEDPDDGLSTFLVRGSDGTVSRLDPVDDESYDFSVTLTVAGVTATQGEFEVPIVAVG